MPTAFDNFQRFPFEWVTLSGDDNPLGGGIIYWMGSLLVLSGAR